MAEPDDATVREVVAALSPRDGSPDDVAASLPREPGLVAWWRDAAPLAVGVATSLRNRVTRQDLWRTGTSWPRRCLAGLLLDELGLEPVWAAEVVLPRADEDRLTAWMHEHLRLGWVADERRRELIDPVTAALAPLLREDTEPARGAEERFVAAAGTRPVRDPRVPYRRP